MTAHAPLVRPRPARPADAKLRAWALFHLNLMFSSIAEDRRAEVIARCYWPLLAMSRDLGLPIAVEATGLTLDLIAATDPGWIAELRAGIAAGRIAFIGSGRSQVIGPLVPARVTEANLRLGLDDYDRQLGIRPRIALVNEQAYAPGLVPLYRDAGFEAIVMDFDACAALHPEWPREAGRQPKRVRGGGAEIGLLWTSAIAFQRLQRFAHGDITLEDWRGFVRGRMNGTPGTLALYGSDAEVFDFRPGRFASEEVLEPGVEWARLRAAFAATLSDPAIAMVLPTELIAETGGAALTLETPANPAPVKKQPKYALSRWALTGRDDLGLNTDCHRALAALGPSPTDPDLRELLLLWSSDARTHIGERRWQDIRTRMDALLDRLGAPAVGAIAAPPGHAACASGREIILETPMGRAVLDRRRGLAVRSLSFAGDDAALIGSIPHGHFADIALAADWYTGDVVLEVPGRTKITDLDWAETQVWTDGTGSAVAQGRIATPLGPVTKRLTLSADARDLAFDIELDWCEWPLGSLRLGHITLLPLAWDADALRLETHLGGHAPQTIALDRDLDHGAPVSALVSASTVLGMTEGRARFSDGVRAIDVTVDPCTAALGGMAVRRATEDGLFCQLQLSAFETDDTRKPGGARRQRFRFAIGQP